MSKNNGPVIGKYVNLREVTQEDAAFILDLRCNEKKSRFLNKTEYDIGKQKNYIKRYLTLDNEWYFIIENKNHKPLGTIRIYDVKGKQYTGGSWLMVDGASIQETIEGDLLLNDFAFNTLGFELDFYDVRKGNKKVIRYHLQKGSRLVGESDIDYFFELTKDEFNVWKKYIQGIGGLCE